MAAKTLKIPPALWAKMEVEAQRMALTPEIIGLTAIAERLLKTEVVEDDDDEATDDLARSTNISGYKGVFPHGDRWRVLHRGMVIGTYDTVIEAAKARKHAHCAWVAQKKGAKEEAEKAEREAVSKQRDDLMKSLTINTDPPPAISFVQPYQGPRGRKPGERPPPKPATEPES